MRTMKSESKFEIKGSYLNWWVVYKKRGNLAWPRPLDSREEARKVKRALETKENQNA